MKIGIDLGTANVLVYVKGKGVVITEPSVVAVSDDNRIVAIGEEAREMIGRTPGNITAIRPMKDGVIADYVITEAMLRFFIAKATKGRIGFSRPEVMISVPAGVTSVEKRAVRDAALKAGAREAYLIEEPLAVAIGAILGEPRKYFVRVFCPSLLAWLAGLGDQQAFPHEPVGGVDDMSATIDLLTDDAPAILLAHEPDVFATAPARFALTLSGHTHGGQVKILGRTPVVPSRYGNRYVHGYIVEDDRHLIVSGGLGVSLLPVRIGVPPEVVHIHLGT